MNGLLKMGLLVAGVIVALVLLVFWGKLWSEVANQQTEDVAVGEPTTEPVIPKSLEQVALEEYAIEYEGAPRVEVNNDLCDVVKEQCQAQGIRDCEDYEMCKAGVSRQ